MFKKKWPNRIISDNGFEVKIEGRGTIVYIENGKKIITNSEFLVGDADIGLYRNSLNKWTTSNEEKEVSESKRVEIEENIKSALEFAGIKLLIT